MKNKNLLIGGAVVAGLLFLYFRNRQNADAEERSAGAGLGSVGGGAMAQENGGGAVMQTSQPVLVSPVKKQPPVSETTPSTTQLTKFELEARMLKACGVRPLVKGARRNLYNDCLAREKAILRQQGLISFDGGEGTISGLDFDGNLD
jgi:hypothetical protein